jgi:hypothetical protein
MSEITAEFLYEVSERLVASPKFIMRMAFCLPVSFELSAQLPWHKHIYLSVSPSAELIIEGNETSLSAHVILPNNMGYPCVISWKDEKKDKPIIPSDTLDYDSNLIFMFTALPLNDLNMEYDNKPWRKTFMYLTKRKDGKWSIKDPKVERFISYFMKDL